MWLRTSTIIQILNVILHKFILQLVTAHINASIISTFFPLSIAAFHSTIFYRMHYIASLVIVKVIIEMWQTLVASLFQSNVNANDLMLLKVPSQKLKWQVWTTQGP